MEIKVTYIANDGEEFDTEEECREYERRCDPGDSLVMLNRNCVVVQGSDPIDELEHADIFYIRDAEKAREFFSFANEQARCIVPEKIENDGIYIFNETTYGYDDLKAELKRLDDIRKKVTDAAVKMRENK